MLQQPTAPCEWHAVEALLKCAFSDKEQSLATAWVRGWLQTMPCFPRLHVITDREDDARKHFATVPNVSIRANQLAPVIANASSPSGPLAGPHFFIAQWHILWADNFTSAPYLLFYDVDAVPVLPMRCQHLFDDQERIIYRSWSTRSMPWVQPDSDVFTNAANQPPLSSLLARGGLPHGLYDKDFMTTWPVVAPRDVLASLRSIVLGVLGGGCFDEALVRLLWFTHADLIAKAALTVMPRRVRHVHCPHLPHNATPGEASKAIHTLLHSADVDGGEGDYACVRYVAQTEHTRHALRNCHTTCTAFKPYFQAATYAHELLNESNLFEHHQGSIPPRLFHYAPHNRPPAELQRLRAFLLRRDTGRICGVGRG